MNSERLREMFRKSRKPAALAGVVLLAGVLIGWTAADARLDAAPGAAPAASAPAEAPQVQMSRGAALHTTDSYADIVAQVVPAVVTIRTERVVKEAANPFSDDPFFRQFFGQQGHPNVRPQPREEGALGSGVIVSPDGYILTNAHVVEGANQIRVELTDRRTFVAKLVGSDQPSDLAVLKIESNGLHSLPMADTSKVRVGDVVLAVGNPLGVGQTVTMGIISAKGRATGGTADGSFEDFLQTDAPINRGNSGGALVNTRGELVGINSQILSPSGGSIGIGFAIPANMAQNVMAQLIKTGKVRRAKLGVTVQTVSSALAESVGLRDVRGAIVSTVDQDSPAQRAGIERGDVITAFNGQPVTDSNDLRNRVASTDPGSTAAVTLFRNGRQEIKNVKLGELVPTKAALENDNSGSDGDRYGMTLEPLTPELANQMGIRMRRGLVVDEVSPASAASDAGLQPGDVILEVNHRAVTSVAQFREAVSAGGGRPALLLVNRQGNDVFIALAPRK